MYEKKESGSSSKTIIRVGLVGHMFMGVAHSNAYRNAPIWYDLPCNVEMKALCAKDTEENLSAFAAKFGWESIETDWRKLVARDDIDLISVAVPGNLHKEIVIEAAKNGKHVLCEKPLANTLNDAKEMLEAAQNLDFERAAFLRDQLKELKELPELVLVDSKKKKRDFIASKKTRIFKNKTPSKHD